MAVLLETSKGDLVIDLYTEECPMACKNFMKLCKIKYYNDALFHSVQKDFIVQTGDPTGTGKGGSSAYGIMYGEQARFFEDEIHPHIKHKQKGMVGMASAGKDCNASQFYITTGNELDSLDAKRTVFGEITEGMDVLDLINEAFVDDDNRPLQNIRIRHTIVLEDPFEDPPQLKEHVPEQSPEPVIAEGDTRLEDDWAPDQDARSLEEIEESNREKEAHARAVVLEMIGDLPEADSKPPTNMLFVCKLHPVTTEEDLEIIFSRFGNITSCDIIKDFKTGDSLSYAFIGFDTDKASEDAYFKMNNVLIDDRRIKVDFSQSVSHLWRQFKVQGSKADAATGALANSSGGSMMPGGRGGGGGSHCYTCGQQGHIARDCPDAGSKRRPVNSANALALKMPAGRASQHGGQSGTYDLVMEDHNQSESALDHQIKRKHHSPSSAMQPRATAAVSPARRSDRHNKSDSDRSRQGNAEATRESRHHHGYSSSSRRDEGKDNGHRDQRIDRGSTSHRDSNSIHRDSSSRHDRDRATSGYDHMPARAHHGSSSSRVRSRSRDRLESRHHSNRTERTEDKQSSRVQEHRSQRRSPARPHDRDHRAQTSQASGRPADAGKHSGGAPTKEGGPMRHRSHRDNATNDSSDAPEKHKR